MIAVVCLLIAGAAGFMWWRSKANFDSFRWSGLVVMTSQGKVCLLHTSSAPTGPDRTGLHTVAFDPTKSGTIIQWPTCPPIGPETKRHSPGTSTASSGR